MLYKGGTFLEVVNSIWLFFQDQILGMKWLNGLIGNGLSQLVSRILNNCYIKQMPLPLR